MNDARPSLRTNTCVRLLRRIGLDPEPLALWFGLMIIVSGGLYLFLMDQAGEGYEFSGTLISYHDANAFMMFIEQYRRAPVLLTRVLFTTDEHEPFIFNLAFWIAGRIAAFTGLGSMLVFHLLRLFFALIAFQWLWQLAGVYFKERFWQWVAVLFVLLNLKMPFVDYPPFSYDFGCHQCWYAIRNLFLKCHYYPLYAVASALLIGMFYTLARTDMPIVRRALLSSLACAALGLVHHYDFPLPYLVLIIYFLLAGAHATRAERWISLALVGLPGLLNAPQVFLAYGQPLGLEMAEEYQGLLEYNQYLHVYGVPLAAALGMAIFIGYGCLRERGRLVELFQSERSRLGVACALGLLITLLLPVAFAGRLVSALEVPITIFGIYAIRLYTTHRIHSERRRIYVVGIMCILCCMATFAQFTLFGWRNYLGFHRELHGAVDVTYLSGVPNEIGDALRWIETNTAQDATFLAPLPIANYIAGRTCRTVYVGHKFMVPDFGARERDRMRFYAALDPAQHCGFLRQIQTDYVVVLLQWINDPTPQTGFRVSARSLGLSPLLANRWLEIYSAEEYERAAGCLAPGGAVQIIPRETPQL